MQLGRENYCLFAEEMRERLSGVPLSTDPGAQNF
jgi:hypothetical protein